MIYSIQQAIDYINKKGGKIARPSSIFYHIKKKHLIPDGYLGKSPYFYETTLLEAITNGIGQGRYPKEKSYISSR